MLRLHEEDVQGNRSKIGFGASDLGVTETMFASAPAPFNINSCSMDISQESMVDSSPWMMDCTFGSLTGWLFMAVN
jgi:hypothetical protein